MHTNTYCYLIFYSRNGRYEGDDFWFDFMSQLLPLHVFSCCPSSETHMIYSGVSNIWGQGDEMCDKQGHNPLFESVSA